MPTDDARLREARVRAKLRRRGLVLHKSRARDLENATYGRFCIADQNNRAVAGTEPWPFSLNLDEVEAFIAEAKSER